MERARELIRKKRDGEDLTTEEVQDFVSGFLEKKIPDYQMAAMLMSIFFRGLSTRETLDLTKAMWKSGVSLPRAHREDYWIDKHSTGGVGDKTSLLLVPIVTATCRRLAIKARIPMISGRSLGHSAGTLDKLESVPGFSSALEIPQALEVLSREGFFMMGQTEQLAPADRRIYALRDVIASVESLPLIVSSIMSKKLSENLDGLVFDVKYGGGSFMQSVHDARRLATTLVSVSRGFEIESVAVLTSMNEPLGYKSGNFLEVEECADFLSLKNAPEQGLAGVTYLLASRMVFFASRGKYSVSECEAECQRSVSSGESFDVFIRMFKCQGGNWSRFEEERRGLPSDLNIFEYKAPASGFINGIDAKKTGLLISDLGAGRSTASAPIDLRVGVEFTKKVGDEVLVGESVAKVYYRRSTPAEKIETVLSEIFVFGGKCAPTSWVLEVIE